MTDDLATLEALVPNVPPEEANYLEKEYSAAIQSGAGRRIYAVENRRRFAAWNLHNAFDDARAQLKLPRPAALGLKMKIQMASLNIPYSMGPMPSGYPVPRAITKHGSEPETSSSILRHR
jgi:hypothetical protein